MRRILHAVALSLAPLAAFAQPSNPGPFNPPPNGPRRADSTWVALSDCTVHVKPGVVLEHASVVIRDGVIQGVLPAEPAMGGESGVLAPRLPIGPRVVDASGMHLYAAFVDPAVDVDVPAPTSERPGKHWNPNVTPERDARDAGGLDAATSEALRKLGFATAGISPRGGVFKGWTAVVSLAKSPDDRSSDRPPIYRERALQGVSFEGGQGGYPGSQMGAIALIRQTLSDAADQQSRRMTQGLDGPRNALDELWQLQVEGSGPGAPVLLFDTSDELEALRAAKIAREFNRPALILGSGLEFRRLDAIKADGLGIILPLNFPRAPDVSTPARQDAVELRDLMTWEQAPTNPRRLARAGVSFSLTTAKLRDRPQFTANLRKAIRCGLTEDEALAALTTVPAEFLGVTSQVGTIEAGKRANIILADGPIFAEKTRLHAVYVDGRPHELYSPTTKLEGEWTVTVPGAPEANRRLLIDEDNAITVHMNDKSVKATRVQVEGSRASFSFDHQPLDGTEGVFVVSAAMERDDSGRPAKLSGQGIRASGEPFAWSAERRPDATVLGRWRAFEIAGVDDGNPDDNPLVTIRRDAVSIRVGDKAARGEKVQVEGGTVSFEYDNKPFGEEGVWKDSARVEGDLLVGESVKPDGTTHAWKARRETREEPKKDDEDPSLRDIPERLVTPFGPYGLGALPKQASVAFVNATLWTNTDQGVIEHATLIISEGKIVAAGADTRPPDGMPVIDCEGKHITPGIIDCHSHTGISRGVNEGGQAVTAECRIEDVTNPDTSNWYWQLAGGVTAVNNLHGSANAIGGQSQTNKVRWGVSHPDQMHFEGAKPGIKFALGENPRRANSGPARDQGGAGGGGARYPTSRMGVEMLIRDRFTAAREYAAARKGSNPPQRDLELDALAEILAGERLVHCHSYRQDEILMLCKVAQEFGFKIGTFQHILEGYKVADQVRDHSGGGSGFTDWWAYKMEVQDAIPGGLPLMHDVGAVVSFNSDSDELARRLNVEAGKAVKYGNVTEAEALKFVTLNPAKQLMVDSRVGALARGLDADIAVWSGPPMSTFSRCERTYVDGRELFSLGQDTAHRKTIAAERARLIQKLLAEPKRPQGDNANAREGGPGGAGGPAGPGGRRRRPPSEDEMRALQRQLEDLQFRGKTPNEPGVCGCGLEHEW